MATTATTTTPLWETNHPYYCNDGNYFDNDCVFEYDSWSEFYDALGTADEDYNLVFRWDWKLDADEDGDGEPEHKLHLYYMGQRKGLYSVSVVRVTKDDEPAVRAWLTQRADHIKRLWDPFL